MTGGLFDSCESHGRSLYVCSLKRPLRIDKSPVPLPPGPMGVVGEVGDRGIPVCAGGIFDAGPGLFTRLSIDDVHCEYLPVNRPTRLVVDAFFPDPDQGFPTENADGSLTWEGTLAAQGRYTAARLYAVSATGETSMPFTVYFRNRWAPEVVATTLSATRSVESILRRTDLVRDRDADEQGSEPEAAVTVRVLRNATRGSAWIDASGSLHYRSMPDARIPYVDSVLLEATDSFGLSTTFELTVTIDDLAPSCADTGGQVTAGEPIRILLQCWLSPPDGWQQYEPMTYTVDSISPGATVLDFDPVAGVLIAAPESWYDGPVVVDYAAHHAGHDSAAHAYFQVARPTP